MRYKDGRWDALGHIERGQCNGSSGIMQTLCSLQSEYHAWPWQDKAVPPQELSLARGAMRLDGNEVKDKRTETIYLRLAIYFLHLSDSTEWPVRTGHWQMNCI